MTTNRLLTAALSAVVILSTLLGYVYVERNRKIKLNQRATAEVVKAAEAAEAAANAAAATIAALRREQSHYLHLYKQYSATERHRQYGLADENVAIYFGTAGDFIPIEKLTETLICPKPVKDPPDGFTFYAVRNAVLERKGSAPLFYSMSYYGPSAAIRDKDWFDSLLDLGALGDARSIFLPASRAAGLMEAAPKPLTRNGSFFTPFSFNSADVNGDGTDDFFFGGRLFLSGAQGYRPISDRALDGREVIFSNEQFLSPAGGTLEFWSLRDGGLARDDRATLALPVSENRPFTILPLNGAVTDKADAIILTASSLDFYALRDDSADRVLSIPAPTPHSIIVGARGDFDGDGTDDLWLAESRWKDKEGRIVGRASLLSSRRFTTDAKSIEDLTGFTLYGSERYTNYDGIGASLSPVAGDFDGDGKPDLSVTGHINLNEAGALYILLGRDMTGTGKSVADQSVIRIAGKPVSNLAPPFVHYDADKGTGRNRIVVAADNDLCSGIAGGAIYVLDISKAL